MPRSIAPFALACAALLLVLFPLTLQKPGLPASLKADEPAYYLMARSLWEDHDLACETRDLLRVSDEFLSEANNLILMSRDGWRHVSFAKPYFGSLLAAPAVAAFGVNGFFAFNMGCLLASAGLGFVYLRRFNPASLALLLSGAYFLVSVSWVYVFWLQPECFSLFAVTATLFFSLHEFAPPPDSPPRTRSIAANLVAPIFNDSSRWLWAGLAIGPAINGKPVYAVALLPGAIAALARWRPRRLVALGLGTALSTFGIAAGQHLLTGTWSPYLGVERSGFNVRNPNWMPTPQPPPEVAGAHGSGMSRIWQNSPTGGDWSWVFHWPGIERERFARDVRNYLIGRHTGVLVYHPFLVVALILFVTGGGLRSAPRWGIVAALVAFILFFIVWKAFNYHGGGGFVGNRYFVGIYPAALFLVTRVRPRAALVLGFLLGGLFLGQILFAPLGPPVDAPTLQAYMRGTPFRWLPYEFTLPRQIPGYHGVVQGDAYLRGRKDEIAFDGAWLTVIGRGSPQLFYTRGTKASSAAFLVRSFAPGNRVRLGMAGKTVTLQFPDAPPPVGGFGDIAVFPLGKPDEVFQEWRKEPEQYWYLDVATSRAARPSWWGLGDPGLIGASLLHVGAAEVLERDVYAAEWRDPSAPAEVEAGASFVATAVLINHSGEPWTLDSPVQVHLSYRWIDAAGNRVGGDGRRSVLPHPLRPGDAAPVRIDVTAPEAEGELRLVLEPVYEYVGWFGDVDPASRTDLLVCVRPRPEPAIPAAAPPRSGAGG